MSPSAPAATCRKETLFTRRQVEDLIAQGRTILIIDNKVIKADSWLRFHPGGDKAIMHMVGRDATDEVNALHSSDARRKMNSFQIGRVEGPWTNFLPPIQGGVFRRLEDHATSHAQGETPDESSSSETSEAPSPVFDPVDVARQTVSHRKPFTRSGSGASSATSLSSLDIADQPKEPDISEADKLTQQQLDFDLAKYPSLEPSAQAEIVTKYRALYKRMQDEGLFRCPYGAYAIEGVRYTILFSLCCLLLHLGQPALAGLFLGAFWHQLVFTAHDAGHMGITGDFQKDSVIGIIITDFLGGLSMGWWKRNHNVHHIVTNSPEHDPDIEHMPFFAISHRFFGSLTSSFYDRVMTYDIVARTTLRYQHLLYYPLLAFGRFNLYVLSWTYLILGQGPKRGPAAWFRWLEIAGNIFFWLWFGYGMLYRSIDTTSGRLAFLLVSHIVTMPLHVQITLSHFAMSTADLGVAESFPQKMLRTTMDVDCPTWLDWFHGGLQFQAVHHLYPRMPRHNLRRAQALVKDFCKDTGIPYALYGFVDGNREVIGKLGEVGRQARVLAECQRAVACKPLDAH